MGIFVSNCTRISCCKLQGQILQFLHLSCQLFVYYKIWQQKYPLKVTWSFPLCLCKFLISISWLYNCFPIKCFFFLKKSTLNTVGEFELCQISLLPYLIHVLVYFLNSVSIQLQSMSGLRSP
jgi:hypothetical protein